MAIMTPAAGPGSSNSGPDLRTSERPLRGITRLFPPSIRTTIFLLLFAVIIPRELVEVSHYFNLFEERREQEYQHNLELARSVAVNFDSFVQDILHEEMIIGTALSSTHTFSEEQISQLLVASANEEPAVHHLAWLSPEGRILTASDPAAVARDLSDHKFYEEISPDQDWYLSDIYQRSPDEVAFAILRGVRDQNGDLLGIMVAEIDPRRLGEALRFDRSGQAAYIIIDRQGHSVYRYPETQTTWEQRNLISTQPIIGEALTGKEVSGLILARNGRQRMASYTPTDSMGWIASASREEEEVTAPIFQELLRESVIDLALTAGTLVFGLLIVLYIVVPTKRLHDRAIALGQGNLKLRMVAGGPIELKELANAFNRTADEIEVRDEQNRLAAEALQEAHRELELRVQRRTADLVKANEGLQSEITEREKAEEALRESEEKYRTLFVLASDALLTSLGPPGGILDANDAAMRMLGYSREELARLTGQGIIAPEVFEETYREWTSQLASHGHFIVETVWVCKDGSRVHVEVSGKPFELGGRVVFQLVGRDITERKRLEEDLRRAQRMETAGRIAGQVAHDFNNLLSPLIGYPELIKLELPDDHPMVKYCDAMLNAAEQMADINEDLLTLSRRGHFNQEPTNLNTVVEQAVANIAPLPETLALTLNLSRSLFPVSGSSAQLLRIVTNLLSNAREAMMDVGRLTIETDNTYVDEPIGSSSRILVGEYVRLRVIDTGCGIPKEIGAKIFDPFFTTKRADRRRGSGLGLSVVQVIVEDHQGYVDMESEVGKGTTFSIYLPVCRQKPESAAEVGLRGGTESILIVDDDSAQREVLSQLLKTLGYKVTAAASGENALDHLKEQQTDLLILDMIMPGGIDGTEAYRRALQLRPGQKAVILSGFAESVRVLEAQALGAGAYIRKPVTLINLSQAVRAELDRKP